MTAHAWLQLATDIVLPSLAILISAGIAIWLASRERRASERSREQERSDRIHEDVLASLAFFTSANPLSEEMSSSMRRLRAQVILMQSLPREHDRLTGLWLARETEAAIPLYSTGMAESVPYNDPSVEDVLRFFDPAHRAFHGCLITLSARMRGEVDDEALLARIRELTPTEG